MATGGTNLAETVLVIGGGGREHAIVNTLLRTTPLGVARLARIYWSPGNGAEDPSGVVHLCEVQSGSEVEFCQSHGVTLVIVGPEVPLEDGIQDRLDAAGIACFGPSKKAAEIECSKAFSKDFMIRSGLPTARHRVFSRATTTEKDLKDFFDSSSEADGFLPLVVKASGLAAGKGVLVAKTTDEAWREARRLLFEDRFGAAAADVVVEECLAGVEVSALCFTDGASVRLMPLAQDHKRLRDGDCGPNTGGMGAFAPFPGVDDDTRARIEQLLLTAVRRLDAEGRRFVGVLYAGLMISEQGTLNLLEFNCRFGDPETQVILSLLDSSLLDICLACVKGNLADTPVRWLPSLSACVVVVAVEGYPDAYKKGLCISGVEAAERTDSSVRVLHAGTRRRADKRLLTAGGRVLGVLATAPTLADARARATRAAECVRFGEEEHEAAEGANVAFFRRDIALACVLRSQCKPTTANDALSYADAGVSVEAGNRLVAQIKRVCAATRRPGCCVSTDGGAECSMIGGFGAVFDLKAAGFSDPVLVMGTDGVGTKLEIARQLRNWSTIGADLVAMCANDLLCHGAEPLAFLDYYVSGRLDVPTAAQVVAGIAAACEQIGCALVGGETAEMPGMYADEQMDIAGFCVGAIDRAKRFPPLPHVDNIEPGDVVFGFASSGVHSNGFSLVRKIVAKSGVALTDACPWDARLTLGESLLTPTRLYVSPVLAYLDAVGYSGGLKALAHITGGGLTENIPRVLPERMMVQLDAAAWPMLEVFKWLHACGPVTAAEMARTFNCGVGLVAVVGAAHAEHFLDAVRQLATDVHRIGTVRQMTPGGDELRVCVDGLEAALHAPHYLTPTTPVSNGVAHKPKTRVAILISGSGTNMEALIRHSELPDCHYEVVLVISNVADVNGITIAKCKGIETQTIPHGAYSSREAFEASVDAALTSRDVELVCLAGFMRVLTGWFVGRWRARLLNVHPSLLPAFKGAHAHRSVLAARVRVTGCTVHFVETEVDSGAIVEQATVRVLPDDTEASLAERVKREEHRVFPLALEMIASGEVRLDRETNTIQRRQ